MRKLSEIWNAIDDQRPKNIKKLEWKRSYEGVKAAIEYLGYTMITSKEEFDAIPIPVSKTSQKHYLFRKIIISRDNIQSIPVAINSLLQGNTTLKTQEEMKVIYNKVSDDRTLTLPKGISTCSNNERKSIDYLDTLLNIDKYLNKVHLLENRLADVAYCFLDDDMNKVSFIADQVKTAHTNKQGRLDFGHSGGHMIIKNMIDILEKNMSLTCIAIKDDKPDVVWYFTQDAIEIFKTFNETQQFRLTLHLKRKSDNKFTNAMNDPIYRFDIEKSSSEIERLLNKKLEYVKLGIKYSIQYLNEDDSQIPGETHRIEQRSFAMTREACSKIDIKVIRLSDDGYTSIDFRINNTIKVQDKCGTKCVSMRLSGGYPYNPDTFDIFQISNLETQEVYAIPMRIISDNKVLSTFSEKILMSSIIFLKTTFDQTYEKYKYDFKTLEGIHAYVANCEAASQISILTDTEFYKNMLDNNADKFGSLKQLARKK